MDFAIQWDCSLLLVQKLNGMVQVLPKNPCTWCSLYWNYGCKWIELLVNYLRFVCKKIDFNSILQKSSLKEPRSINEWVEFEFHSTQLELFTKANKLHNKNIFSFFILYVNDIIIQKFYIIYKQYNAYIYIIII